MRLRNFCCIHTSICNIQISFFFGFVFQNKLYIIKGWWTDGWITHDWPERWFMVTINEIRIGGSLRHTSRIKEAVTDHYQVSLHSKIKEQTRPGLPLDIWHALSPIRIGLSRCIDVILHRTVSFEDLHRRGMNPSFFYDRSPPPYRRWGNRQARASASVLGSNHSPEEYISLGQLG